MRADDCFYNPRSPPPLPLQRFSVAKTSLCHGLGCWFDLTFSGSESIVTLSTAPEAPQTHWYQCRLMLETPLAVNATQVSTQC